VKVFNQTTECHNINVLAQKVSELTGAEIRYYQNPRNEVPKNDLRFCKDSFLDLGLKPITLSDGLIIEVADIATKYKDRCDKSKIIATSTWRSDMPVDYEGSSEPVENGL